MDAVKLEGESCSSVGRSWARCMQCMNGAAQGGRRGRSCIRGWAGALRIQELAEAWLLLASDVGSRAPGPRQRAGGRAAGSSQGSPPARAAAPGPRRAARRNTRPPPPARARRARRRQPRARGGGARDRGGGRRSHGPCGADAAVCQRARCAALREGGRRVPACRPAAGLLLCLAAGGCSRRARHVSAASFLAPPRPRPPRWRSPHAPTPAPLSDPLRLAHAGGFRPQAQVAGEALRVLHQAQALQAAGCFSLVLECVPGPIAAAVTKAVNIPTIGIGAGPATSGQARGRARRARACGLVGARGAGTGRGARALRARCGRRAFCRSPKRHLRPRGASVTGTRHPSPAARSWCTTTCWA